MLHPVLVPPPAELLEEQTERPGDDAPIVVPLRTAGDGVRFAAPRLSVGEEGGVVPLEGVGDGGQADLGKYGRLGSGRG